MPPQTTADTQEATGERTEVQSEGLTGDGWMRSDGGCGRGGLHVGGGCGHGGPDLGGGRGRGGRHHAGGWTTVEGDGINPRGDLRLYDLKANRCLSGSASPVARQRNNRRPTDFLFLKTILPPTLLPLCKKNKKKSISF